MTACLWCPALLPEERGRGSPRRFCSAACRQACHAAARRWAMTEIATGRLTIATIRAHAQESVRASPGGHLAPAGAAASLQTYTSLSGRTRKRGPLSSTPPVAHLATLTVARHERRIDEAGGARWSNREISDHRHR